MLLTMYTIAATLEYTRILTARCTTVHSLYRSPNIVRVIKSRRLRWAGHVARMAESRSAFKMLSGKPTGKRPLGRPIIVSILVE